MDAKEQLDKLGAKWSPDLDSYAAGEQGNRPLRCALCANAPCQCPPFGSEEYMALIDKRHGNR